jgi:exosome complex component RRP45
MSVLDVKSLPLHIFRPVDHVRSFLKNSVRVDGRGLDQSRPIKVAGDVLQGQYVVASSQVQLGGSSVMCAISIMIGMPSVFKPNQGDTSCVVSMNQLSLGNPNLPNKEGVKPTIATDIEHAITSLFNLGNVFDLTQLCLVEVLCLSLVFIFCADCHVVCFRENMHIVWSSTSLC